MFFLHLLLLTFPSVADGLSCVGVDIIFEVNYEHLTQNILEERLDELVPIDSSSYTVCSMAITIDYTNKLLTVEFDAAEGSTSSHEPDNYFFLYTNFTFQPTRTHWSKFFKSCSAEDYCDRKFLVNKRSWWSFIEKIDHTPLETILYEIIENKSTQNVYRCLKDKEIISCQNKMCAAIKERDKNHESYCYSKMKPDTFIIIEIELDTAACTQTLQSIQYTCRFDMCNDRAEIDNVYNAINQYYDLSPFLSFSVGKNIHEPMLLLFLDQLVNTTISSNSMSKKIATGCTYKTVTPISISNATMASSSITISNATMASNSIKISMNISKLQNVFLVLILVSSFQYY